MRYFFVGLGRAVWWGLLLPLAVAVYLLRALGRDPNAQVPYDLGPWAAGLSVWTFLVLVASAILAKVIS